MYSRFLRTAFLVPALASIPACHPAAPEASPGKVGATLRVCSDPNNLPFSNEKLEGFENRIAELMARDLDAQVEYTWFAQRRGFIRNTLNAGKCDVVMGVPNHFDPVDTTRPYYRSTYVFVTRAADRYDIDSMDDARLRTAHIGVHIVGDDYANPPPVHALGRRNIVTNVTGYSIYGDYSQPNPPARLVDAVAAKDVDIAILWGPFGGYFGARQPVEMRVTPLSAPSDGPELPFAFAIALGVRKGDDARREQLQTILDRRRPEIEIILDEYRIPRVVEEHLAVAGR